MSFRLYLAILLYISLHLLLALMIPVHYILAFICLQIFITACIIYPVLVCNILLLTIFLIIPDGPIGGAHKLTYVVFGAVYLFRQFILKKPVIVEFSFLLLMLILSTTFSLFVNHGADIKQYIVNNFIGGAIFYLALYNIAGEKSMRIKETLIATFIIILLYTLYQVFTHKGVVIQGILRKNSVFSHPNSLGYFCNLIQCYFMTLFFIEKNWMRRTIFASLITACLTVCLFSGSRTAICINLMIILFSCAFNIKLSPKKILIAALILVTLLFSGSLFLVKKLPELSSKTDSIQRAFQGVGTLNGRTFIWNTFRELKINVYLFGIGHNEVRDIMREADMRIMTIDKLGYHYHNSFLDLIARHGIFSCVAFYLFLISLLLKNFIQSIRFSDEREGAQHTVLVILLFLLNGLTESFFLDRTLWIYFMSFLAIKPSFKKLTKKGSDMSVPSIHLKELCLA